MKVSVITTGAHAFFVADAASSTPGPKQLTVLHAKYQPMPNKTVWTCVWFVLVVSAANATLPSAQAEVTFFTSRAEWEAEASNRGLSFAEEDFDGFRAATDIPPFSVGEIRFDPRDPILRDGKLVPGIGGAVRFGGGQEWFGTIEGPIGGIGMDLDVPENAVRHLNVWPCPFSDPLCEPSMYGPFASERRLGDGFIGVLFDSPSQLEWFIFGGSVGFNSGDNLVVASFLVPEPSTLRLAAAVALTLGVLRRKRTS